MKLEMYINKIELYVNGEILDSSHDRKTLSQIPLRDKTVIVAKVYDGPVCGSGGCGSSNESSSDSSNSSPPSTPTPEHALPGVLFAQGSWYLPFILDLEHIGITKKHAQLTEAAHLISQICPAHKQTVEKLTEALLCRDDSKLKDMLYGPAPPTVAYNMQVLHSMVLPSTDSRLERSRNFQLACVKKAQLLVLSLSDKDFLYGAASHTRRVGYLSLVRLVKLILYTLGHLFEILAPHGSDLTLDNDFRMDVTILREALQTVSNHNCELIVKTIAEKISKMLAQQYKHQVVANRDEGDSVTSLLWWRLPTIATVRALYTLAYCVAQPFDVIGAVHPDDVTLVRECMEVVTICMALGGGHLEMLLHEAWWQDSVLYLMIDCPNAQVRVSCAEQLLVMCAWGGGGGARGALGVLSAGGTCGARLQRHARHAQQFLQLICRLVSLAGPTARTREDLAYEVNWLRTIRANPELVDDTLLEGHLNLTKELFNHVPTQVKFQYGAHPDHKDAGLIKEVMTEFLWPYSWAWCQMGDADGDGDGEGPREPAPPLYFHYIRINIPLSEWEYMPSVGPRPPAGMVGLKNAGATCYMNSVLQQLYCVRTVRDVLLSVQGAATDPNEDFSGDLQHHSLIENNTENSGDYNLTILKQVQAIFAHLQYSKLQYYVPRGLWAHFKLQGEPVNLREQQDAVEFFMSLVESLDEALKTLGQEQLMAKTMGGTYSDQKICKGCPHRYCKEEPFSVVSLDIRNMSRLQESLEAYVRGELLEGADAYYCDKCSKKVVTVKRLCLNKLPPVLVIQLKRFEYDFEKVCAIKFNDYFEFPRELDVEPYTAWGLARAEGDATLWDGGEEQTPETHYQLSGIVVHSGQASGGHYYSYVLLRDNGSESGRWVKMDDGDVSECGMHDDEEMKAQCFGGEYMSEVFDSAVKRVSYKRQKRWWNAYMLFYTRKDTIETPTLEQSMKSMTLKETTLPKPIWQSVRRSNIAFCHNQDQFSLEHFNFMKKLCCMRLQVLPGSQSAVWAQEHEEMSMLAVQLATKFLFQVGFHTKKTLRGPASDWHEIVCQHLRCSQTVRVWFAGDLFKYPHRLCDYLLTCPSVEVRLVFMKILVFLAHFAFQDPPVSGGWGSWTTPDEAGSLSDQVMCAVRALAAPQHVDAHQHRNLPLLFNLFHAYAVLGYNEKQQLLRLKILDVVLTLCMDDNIVTAGKHQYPDSAKVHQVVCVLARCCDVSMHCQSLSAGEEPLPNPYGEPLPAHHAHAVRPPLSPVVAELLYNRTGTYVKKLTEECCGCEEGVRLLQFLCWENAGWSRVALSELLWQMAYAYCHELRRHTEALSALLLLEDSWQQIRIQNAIKGISEERPGLLETAIRARGHYQKRAYACLKLVVSVMCRAPAAVRTVHSHIEARRRWRQLLAWLQDELDRKFGPGGYGSYGSWSPPGTSNESSSGYFLERSNSARKTLEKAYQLCPEDEDEEEESRETAEGSGSGEAGDGSGDEEDAAEEEGPARRLQLAPPALAPAPAPAPAPALAPAPAPAPASPTPRDPLAGL
ncbi:putative ubiquitin carboxyl-terminal hydrolase FAF [Papilio xuthus]|uniref:Putative ubiquitin carboxyl-terminal hydrolase FAF n=1 Tax=Papilio xuthus TaxID=66420 RepID=A0A194PQK0_PAPXU|nr:putative ubiquitin carboxyl-terminal hydrolase FAF [Papilio xuthus]